MQVLLRNLFALVAGGIVAGLAVAVIETLGVLAYPQPPGFDRADEQAMRAFIASLPTGAFVYILAAYLVGTLAGVTVATRLSRRRPSRQGWVLGLVLLVSGLVNFYKYPHPLWFMVASVAVFLGATWLGVRLGRPRLLD